MTANREVEQRLLETTEYLCNFCRNVVKIALRLQNDYSLLKSYSEPYRASYARFLGSPLLRRGKDVHTSSNYSDCIICHRLSDQFQRFSKFWRTKSSRDDIDRIELSFQMNVRELETPPSTANTTSVNIMIEDSGSPRSELIDSFTVNGCPCESSKYQAYVDGDCSNTPEGTGSVVWIDDLHDSRSTGSPEAFSHFKFCLRECITGHSECALPIRGYSLPSADRWRPTRLLSIGPDGTRVRLLQHDDLSTPVDYVTLSHCWGEVKNRYRLTVSTISHLRQGVPVAQLPTLFRDSIAFAHNCGLKYIWIDSLCIVQDSPEDWQRESALMSLVYETAVFTIAALVSTSDEDSLYRERNPRTDLGFKLLALIERAGPPSDLSAKVDPTQTITSDAQAERMFNHVCVRWEIAFSLFSELHFPPLFDRAWVFQEKMLSRRIIGFGGFAAIWSCSEGTIREGNPREKEWHCLGMHPRKQMRHLAEAASEMLRVQKIPRVRETPYILLAHWNAIVERYAKCVLTKPTDRLIALSALANEFYMISTDRYLAGLWERSLVIGLAWSAYGINPAGAGPDFIAPTWSWASVNSGIVNHHQHAIPRPY